MIIDCMADIRHNCFKNALNGGIALKIRIALKKAMHRSLKLRFESLNQ